MLEMCLEQAADLVVRTSFDPVHLLMAVDLCQEQSGIAEHLIHLHQQPYDQCCLKHSERMAALGAFLHAASEQTLQL